MSVVRSKRGESEVEFLHTARELEMYSIRKCVNFPKRFTFYLSQPIANKVMTAQDVYASVQSWFAYTKNFNAYRTRRCMGALYDRMFIFNLDKEELA